MPVKGISRRVLSRYRGDRGLLRQNRNRLLCTVFMAIRVEVGRLDIRIRRGVFPF